MVARLLEEVLEAGLLLQYKPVTIEDKYPYELSTKLVRFEVMN